MQIARQSGEHLLVLADGGRDLNLLLDDLQIDLQADLMRFTVDTIAGLAFGSEVNTLESDEDVIQDHLNRIFPTVFKRIFAPLPTWRWWPSADDLPDA